MALNWPAGIYPKSFSRTPIVPNEGTYTAPSTGAAQLTSSAIILFEFEFDFPSLSYADYLRVVAMLDQAGQDEFQIPLYNPFIAPVASGAILVAAGSSNKSLNVSGVNTGYAPKAGSLLAINTGGRYYLYSLASDSVAGAATRTLALTGTLRAPPNVGDAIAIEPAYIQGRITADSRSAPIGENGRGQIKIKIRETK